jgi:ADP-heptose:LPS heptosyltransferase
VVGGPGEKALATEIVAAGGPASLAVSNDSGLMHVAAAHGTPTMGIWPDQRLSLGAPCANWEQIFPRENGKRFARTSSANKEVR